MLPTGALEPVGGTAYDFNDPDGRPLGDLYLDDCFTDLAPASGVLAELRDPAAGLGLRLRSPSSDIRAIQVFAPPDAAFVVLEPQFNLAAPSGAVWDGLDTGMVMLPPGGGATYNVRVEPFAV